jgi:site-specific recombinase XerD
LKYNEYLKKTDAEATIQNKIAALNQFFKFAVKLNQIEENPFAIVKQKRPPSRAGERFLTVKQLDKLLDALYQKALKKPKHLQRYVAGLLSASIGPRISEVVGINRNDFLEFPDGSFGVKLHRKGNEYQIIPLREDVWEVIREFIGGSIDQLDNRPLFVNPSGNRITDVTLREWIREGAKTAGIRRKIKVHDLRHSCATHLLDQGETLENVRWLLNHKDIRTTQIYTGTTNKKISEKMPIKVKCIKETPVE